MALASSPRSRWRLAGHATVLVQLVFLTGLPHAVYMYACYVNNLFTKIVLADFAVIYLFFTRGCLVDLRWDHTNDVRRTSRTIPRPPNRRLLLCIYVGTYSFHISSVRFISICRIMKSTYCHIYTWWSRVTSTVARINQVPSLSAKDFVIFNEWPTIRTKVTHYM